MSSLSYQKRPKMTADQAISFQGVSQSSMIQVQLAIDARTASGVHASCECSPYLDVFTFNRWKAQGLFVNKGEKALKIASFTPVEGQDGKEQKDEESKTRLRPCTVCLFCRCQVSAKEAK